MTLTQYNTTVGHTGIARLCLAQKCYRTRTKLAEVGEDVTMLSLLNEGAITFEDLEDFSEDLQDTLKHFAGR